MIPYGVKKAECDVCQTLTYHELFAELEDCEHDVEVEITQCVSCGRKDYESIQMEAMR